MVSGNPCCPRVDPVANGNLSISSVYSYEQRSFQDRPPAVFDTWFNLVEVWQLSYIWVLILFHVMNVALVLRQVFLPPLGRLRWRFVNISAVSDRCVAISGITNHCKSYDTFLSMSHFFTSPNICNV